MDLTLIKPENKYRKQITEMLYDWILLGEQIIPASITRIDYHDFDNYCKHIDDVPKKGYSSGDTYFCYDKDTDTVVGAVNLRYNLNNNLLTCGGNLSDGVIPTARCKGIATKMINLSLELFKEKGLDKILMTCNKRNIASAKSIIKNGGKLENEVTINGEIEQRYWITL